VVKVFIGLLIAALSMFWATKDQSFSAIYQEIAKANHWLILLVGVIFMFQQALRSHRQMMMVRSQLPNHTFMSSFHILCVSFFFINTLPLRMGEVVRPILFFEKEDLPFGAASAIVFLERIIDLISALLMLFIVLGFANIPIDKTPWLAQARTSLVYSLPVISFLAISPFFFHKWLNSLVTSSWFPKRLKPFSHSFLAQIQSYKKKAILFILFETLVIWLFTTGMYLVAAWAFSVNPIGFLESIGLLAFTMLGMAVPSAPGFAGTYEAAFVAGLEVFGSDNATRNIAFALTFHWWIHIVQSSSALFFLYRDGTSISDLWQKIKEHRQSAGSVSNQS
jgi:uncharacterized protein (TIRG00374 family)